VVGFLIVKVPTVSRSISTSNSCARASRKTADAPGQISSEPDLDVVLAVLRKCIRDRRAAACADRQPRDLFFLREIGRKAKDVVC
jgi:hypothetical protein